MSAYDSLAPFYDLLTGDVDYEAFAGFYEKLFSVYGCEVGTILDLACGTGSLTCLLADRGYEMIGVDASPEMLAAAYEKAADKKCPPLFLNQDMAELDLYGTVDAVVCSLDGMNYVPPTEQAEALRRVLLFLEPGGVFVFDINTPYKLKKQDGQVYLDEQEEVYCVWRTVFDEAEGQCCYGMDIFSREGDLWVRSREEHVEYVYEPAALVETLSELGFEEIKVFGEFTLEPPEAEEQRIFIAARKPLQ